MSIFPESIPPLSAAAHDAAQRHLDRLTKPPGSLGQLEEWVARYCAITGAFPPPPIRACALVFCADHGVTAEGVSAFPAEVTVQMVRNFLAGGAAVSALAREAGAEVWVVDAGVRGDFEVHPKLIDRKIARGTRNLAREPAMSREEAERALRAGYDVAREKAGEGANVLILGEMGIGNTTTAAVLSAALLGKSTGEFVGPGTGVRGTALERKREVAVRALARRPEAPADPLEILCEWGGFEIAAMAGAIIGAAASRAAVFVDGFVSTAGALLARALAPDSMAYCFPSHQSAEPGHALQLAALGWRPPVRIEMRLGEGTGALLALGLLRGGLRMMDEMATFESAGVSGEAEPGGEEDSG
ncbi:MAG: nicotinate-nucleotide--dimethylbenzimidazole phosphoribosyltransferase [bacterium]|nr:nicotinate-nucleotide--dimethylbenzimidazole phosphoribosyltransferase [bacterium]